MSLRILPQDQLAQSSTTIVPFFLPESTPPYAARANRFNELAPGHALEAYLRLCAAISHAQAAAASEVDVAAPVREQRYWDQCALHDLPPLGTEGWPRDPVWRTLLAHLLATLAADPALPAETRTVLDRLAACDADGLERRATQLLSGDWSGLDRAEAPFVAAALQVYFNRLAAQLSPLQVGNPYVHAHGCPACGAAPTASRIRPGADGLRYLHCSLCETEWHKVRSSCTQCGGTHDIGYWSLETEDDGRPTERQQPPMRAEGCGDCHAYLKMLDPGKAQNGDVLADDIATLTLDLAMDEKGFERAGPNLLFFPG